jgi:hypothetical protein
VRRALLLASLSVFLAARVPATALVNGSFEPAAATAAGPAGEAIPGWMSSGSVGWREAEEGGSAAPNGERVVRFAAGADRGTCLQQSFATVPGRPYEVVFWLGSRAGAHGRGRGALRVEVDGRTRTVAIDNPSPELLWQARLVSFVARDSQTTLAFRGVNRRDAAPAYLDLVVVRPAAATPAGSVPGR